MMVDGSNQSAAQSAKMRARRVQTPNMYKLGLVVMLIPENTDACDRVKMFAKIVD